MKLYLCAVFLLSGCIAQFVEETYESPELREDSGAIEDLLFKHRKHDFFHHHKHDHDTSEADITFTAVLKEDLDDAGEDQHIKFDSVLVNDEDVYDPNTGVFRAPRCGVYWFAYSVAAKGAKFVKARLMVDNDPINAAVAVSKSGADQGSNGANVHLHKGQKAWIALGKDSSLLVKDGYLYNSFSGGLIYTRE